MNKATNLKDLNNWHPVAALDFANTIRRALGGRPVKSLRKGKRGDGWSCPIANTVKVGKLSDTLFCVGTTYACVAKSRENTSINNAEIHWHVPRDVRDFIVEFDSGRYKDLDDAYVKPEWT